MFFLRKNNDSKIRCIFKKSINAYYKFFDDVLWNSSVLVWIISFMILFSAASISPTSALNINSNLKSNLLEWNSQINSSAFIQLNWVQYEIILKPVTKNNLYF